MKEIELKVLEIKPEDEEKKLIELGFKKIGECTILEKMFDTEKKDLKRKKQILRLRTIHGKIELTLKEKKEKHPFLKMREEQEITVNSFAKMEEILESLGYICMAAREKKRESYKLNNIKVEIDKYPGAEPYMEIEGTEKEVLEMLKKLNHPLERTTNKSATQILKIYKLNTKKLFF
jgi:predicted adenylyl cyclase CyaB